MLSLATTSDLRITSASLYLLSHTSILNCKHQINTKATKEWKCWGRNPQYFQWLYRLSEINYLNITSEMLCH